MSQERDFWLSCGHHLLDRDAGGGLLVTDEFLKAYLARPEIAPPPDACAAERTLHGALLADPRQAVSPAQIAAIADADARENWEVMIAFRDHLVRHRTLEAAYLDIVRRNLKVPHIFLNQLVHVILRNVLDDCEDAFVLRAAEMFFRPQKLTLHDGSLVAADEETVSGSAINRCLRWCRCSDCRLRPRSTCSTRTMPGPTGSAAICSTWRSISPRAARPCGARRGHGALGCSSSGGRGRRSNRLIELQDATLTWYVGLDADATRIGDALWNGDEVDEADAGTRGRALPANLCRSHGYGGEGQRRAGVSDGCDGG